MTMPLTFQTTVSKSYEEAVDIVTTALQNEGFGILTRIDVKETFKKKLDKDFRPYVILGACNPMLAHRALESEPMIGALLPCNVTVEQAGENALVSIINPEAMLGLPPLNANETVLEVAAEAKSRLERVLKSLQK